MPSDIAGVFVESEKIIPDERGNIYKFIYYHDMRGRGIIKDVYITKIRAGQIKAWHGYQTKTLSYVCVQGLVKVVLWDKREDSATYNQVEEHFIGTENYQRITLPPGVFHGFKGIDDAVVVVVADEVYDDAKVIREDVSGCWYDWRERHG